jgi:hypothetical protein
LEAFDLWCGEGWFRDIEPFICAAGTFFDLADCGEVLVEFTAVFAPEFLVHAVCIVGDGVEDTASAAESASDGFFAVAFDSEQHVEELLGVALCGELDAVAGPGEGGALDGHFE